jgi:hypothetical protein
MGACCPVPRVPPTVHIEISRGIAKITVVRRRHKLIFLKHSANATAVQLADHIVFAIADGGVPGAQRFAKLFGAKLRVRRKHGAPTRLIFAANGTKMKFTHSNANLLLQEIKTRISYSVTLRSTTNQC